MRVALALLLLASSLLAQSKPDFSGVYLRTETRFHGQSEAAIPRVIAVKQTADEVLVSASQNLETATVHYRFVGNKNNKAEARLKSKNLVVKSSTEVRGPAFDLFSGGWPLTQTVEEKWELSGDAQQLMIYRKVGQTGEYIDVYTRQSSRDAALAGVAAARSRECADGKSWLGLKDDAVATRTYKQGYELGFVSVQRITRCVTYESALSGELFKTLVRIKDQHGSQFLKNGQNTTAFDGDLVLEVQPRPHTCVGEAGTWIETSPSPESSLDLRFMVRWLGSEQRDLGEIQSELRYEPWRELNTPVAFYRMHIPAKDIPLTADLEVTIFTKSGEQLACMKGHL